MDDLEQHQTNHYHALIQELQKAKHEGYISRIQLSEHDVLVFMDMSVSDTKLSEVAKHISKKYRLFTKENMSSKTITIYDAYMLDPRV